MTEPFLLSVREFAAAEGLGRDLTYRLVAEGRIRAVKVGRTIRIPRTEITDFPARETNGREVVCD